MWQTQDDSESARQAAAPIRPGLVIVWSGQAPVLQAFEIAGDGVTIGRELLEPLRDERISRQH
ncbi:MAG TPA: hypothetical protein VK601_24320, partial [Kofleriaceae bacterium]|nr:hypothetical protein [Kofleriaceae bacterium]